MVLYLEHYILGFNQEGIVYDEWAKHYDKYIASSLKELYQIKAMEQKSPMVLDSVLQISWKSWCREPMTWSCSFKNIKTKR